MFPLFIMSKLSFVISLVHYKAHYPKEDPKYRMKLFPVDWIEKSIVANSPISSYRIYKTLFSVLQIPMRSDPGSIPSMAECRRSVSISFYPELEHLSAPIIVRILRNVKCCTGHRDTEQCTVGDVSTQHGKNIFCQKNICNPFSFQATEMVLTSKWGRILQEMQGQWQIR